MTLQLQSPSVNFVVAQHTYSESYVHFDSKNVTGSKPLDLEVSIYVRKGTYRTLLCALYPTCFLEGSERAPLLIWSILQFRFNIMTAPRGFMLTNMKVRKGQEQIRPVKSFPKTKCPRYG